MGSFHVGVGYLGVSFLPDVVVLVKLVLGERLLGLSSLLIFALFEEILIHGFGILYLKGSILLCLLND